MFRKSDLKNAGEEISALWLYRLRWGAILGQLVLLTFGSLILDAKIYYTHLILSIIALAAVSNLALPILIHKYCANTRHILGSFVFLDVVLLTILLGLTGGAANPFSIFYLVHISLASVILGASWTWSMVALSSVGFALLFFFVPPLATVNHVGHDHFSSHLRGMWIAFTAAAALVAYFQSKTLHALRSSSQELRDLELRLANQERLTAITSLAAGAAHELSTPLSTIAVATKELERAIRLRPDLIDLLPDTELIGNEVTRCRHVLEEMIADAGETLGEMPELLTLEQLRTELEEELGSDLTANNIVVNDSLQRRIHIPVNGLVRSIKALAYNARDAVQEVPTGKVSIELLQNETELEVRVRDNGRGMSREVLARLGEPFFSTKPAGRGMGIGIFLVKLFVERLGGSVRFDSELNRGTVATMRLPQLSH